MPAEITQENVRFLIPGKAAGVAMILAEKRAISPKDALMEFYRSKTYRELERESSKYWHYSPKQLFIVGGLSRHTVKHGPGRSTLLPYRDLILSMWHNRKSARAISEHLAKQGIQTTPQNVWKFLKRHEVSAEEAIAAMKKISDVAQTNGTSELTLDEINAEIAAVRKRRKKQRSAQ